MSSSLKLESHLGSLRRLIHEEEQAWREENLKGYGDVTGATLHLLRKQLFEIERMLESQRVEDGYSEAVSCGDNVKFWIKRAEATFAKQEEAPDDSQEFLQTRT